MSPIDQTIGRNLSRLRRQCGLSVADLAAALSVSSAQLEAFERGCERISASHLYALTKTLGQPIAAFFATTANDH